MAEVEGGGDVSMEQGGPDPQTPQTQEPRPKKTRNRLPVSCEPCRIRRAKCDRERPHCGACSKRGEMEKCLYQVKGAKHGAKSEDGGARIPVAETEDRLRHLESMITQVIQSGRANTMNAGYQAAAPNGYGMQPTPMTTGGDPADASPDPGQLSAIMADLQELRSIITGDHNVGTTDDMYDERTVLLGASTTPSLEFILHQYLPDRQEVESYLAAYFRATFIPIPVIHSGSFQRQLQEFWRTKHHADPIWTGLLFAILAIAAHITAVSTGDGGNTSERFMTASAQCINLGGYTRPKKHLIPALLLLAQAQYTKRLDPSREVRMLVAILSQLAFQDGLHREPPRHLSVFEAEMRRRLFLAVRHFEIQVSCQFGVPAAIPYNSHDVSTPQNLNDEDIEEDMTALPTPREMTEATIVTPFLIKARLMSVLSEVYDRSISTHPSSRSDADITRLDTAIRHEHASIPPKYAIRPISESYTDSEGLIMSRLMLEFLAQKTLCILHRRRMAEGNEYSRKSCVEAASKIITQITDLVPELAPGRQMQGKEYILTSTIVNDFLLASMILCLGVMSEERNAPRRRNSNETRKMREHIDLLNRARALCEELTPRSRGAKRVGEAIDMLFGRLQNNATIDPSLPLGYAGIALSANMNISVNGNPSSYSTYLPTPTPSSTMSQERSTSAAGYTQSQQPSLQQRYTSSTPQISPTSGYDYAANIAAAASAAPLPTTSSSMSYADPSAAAAAALFQAGSMAQSQVQGHGQGQGGQLGLGQMQNPMQSQIGNQMQMQMVSETEPVHRYMMDTSGGEEIDWTAFDQYIVNEGVGIGSSGGGGMGGWGGGGGGFP